MCCNMALGTKNEKMNKPGNPRQVLIQSLLQTGPVRQPPPSGGITSQLLWDWAWTCLKRLTFCEHSQFKGIVTSETTEKAFFLHCQINKLARYLYLKDSIIFTRFTLVCIWRHMLFSPQTDIEPKFFI